MAATIRNSLIALLTGSLAACGAASGGEPAPVSVETEYVTTLGRGEALRLQLGEGEHYRLEVEGRGAQVALEPVEAGVPAPLLNPFSSGASQSVVKVYDFRVRRRGRLSAASDRFGRWGGGAGATGAVGVVESDGDEGGIVLGPG